MKALSIAILAFLSILLVVSYGCVQKPEPVVNEPPEDVVLPVENNTVAPAVCSAGNILQKDDCFLSLAKKKSDPEVCGRIYSVEKLDSCFAIFANADLEICKRITDTDMKAACLAENAKRSKSEEVCNLIGDVDKKVACLKNVLPECMLVSDPEKRSLCIALEKKDYTYCQGDSCFEAYAENKSDSNACGLISSPALRYACFAVVEKRVAECGRAEVSPVRDLCVKTAAIKLNDVDGCDLATTGSDYRNSCYLHFAVAAKNSTFCRRAEPENGRDACYGDYATRAADTSSCGRIIESLNKINCYYKAATNNSMPSLCNPLQVEGQRDDCYAKGVQTPAGPVATDCASVENLIWKDKCYYRAAYIAYNQTLCGFVREETSDRRSCDELFGSG